jgi:hypothetical protein
LRVSIVLAASYYIGKEIKMKKQILLTGSLVMVLLLATACAGQPTVPPEIVETAAEVVTQVPPGAVETAAEVVTTQVPPGTIENAESLLQALLAAGATVELGDQVQQPFFTVPGQILKVNGADVQVFVYETAQAMEAEAAQISADGSSIGTSMANWVESPHFFKLGQLLVLYVGENEEVMNLLEGVFGPQFAGR